MAWRTPCGRSIMAEADLISVARSTRHSSTHRRVSHCVGTQPKVVLQRCGQWKGRGRRTGRGARSDNAQLARGVCLRAAREV